jgi:hypothetical protein
MPNHRITIFIPTIVLFHAILIFVEVKILVLLFNMAIYYLSIAEKIIATFYSPGCVPSFFK